MPAARGARSFLAPPKSFNYCPLFSPRARAVTLACVFRAEGYDPNGSYVGVTALQVALEHDPPNHEMVLILLKFGADPDKNTASRARGLLPKT